MDAFKGPYRVAPRATAFGVPLEQAERVIDVSDAGLRARQGRFGLLGATFVTAGIGCVWSAPRDVWAGAFFFGSGVLAVTIAALMEMFAARRIVVTDRRVLLLARKRKPRSIRLADVGDVRAVRGLIRRHRYRGTNVNDDWLDLCIGWCRFGGDLLGTYQASLEPKTSAGYWEGTAAMVLIGMSAKLRVPTMAVEGLGPFLARCALEPGFAENAPEVSFDP